MDEHTIYKSQPIQQMGWTQPFLKKGLWLSRTGLIPSIKIAGQWRFKKEVIDKWVSEQSLERTLQNTDSSITRKKKINK